MKNNFYIITVLFLLYFLVVLEVVALPSISVSVVEYLNIEKSKITYITTGFNLAGVFAPFFGYYGDRIGKKKMLIAGTVLFIIGTYLTSNVSNLTGFILARSITGLGYYTFISLLFAYIGDFIPFNKRGKVSGLLKGAFALAVFIAPIYSAFIILNFDLNYIYRYLSIAASVLLLFLFTFPESESHDLNVINISVFKKLMSNKDTIKFTLVLFFFTLPGILFFSYFAFHLSDIGLTQGDISKMFVLIAVGSFSAGMIVFLASDRIGKIKLLMIAFIIAIIGMSFLTSTNLVVLIIFLTVFAIGYDIIHGLYLTVCGELFEQERATFISILGLVMAFAQFTISLTAPIINKYGGYNMNVLVALSSLLIGAIIFYGLFVKYRTKLS